MRVTPGHTHSIKVVGGERFNSWTGSVKPQAGEQREVEAKLTAKEVKAAAAPPPAYHAPAYHPVYHAPAPVYRPAYNPPPARDYGAPRLSGNRKM